VPPVPTGTVTLIVLPEAKVVDVATWYNCCGLVFEPENRNIVYVVRSDIDGAAPESIQVTEKAVPPAIEAPAAGTVNSGYPKARGRDATRTRSLLEKRMAVLCSICKMNDLCDCKCVECFATMADSDCGFECS
jgi:hypothetical protein